MTEKVPGTLKPLTVQLVILLFLFLFPFVSSAADVDVRQPLQVIDFQMRWKHQFQFAGYYAAIEKGFYQREGLEVRLHEGAPGRTPVQEVLAGRAQYAEANSELLYERLKGQPLVALAAIFQHSPSVILARADANIHSPQDLIGKRVMLMNEKVDADFHAMLLNEGIRPDTIRILPSSFDINDLASGNVAAFNSYLTNEPFFLRQQGIEYVVINPQKYGIDYYSDILFTSEQELKQNPERVKAFRRATLYGWQYAMNHPAEIIELLISKYNVKKSREHLQFEADAMRALILPDLIEMGHMNPGRWQHMADTFVKVGMVDNVDKLDGFMYNPNPSGELLKLRKTVITITVAGSLLLLVTVGLFAIQQRLRIENEQRKKAEEALSDSLERYRTLAELSPDGILVNFEGTFTYANPAARRMLGATEADQIVGKPALDFIDRDYHELVKQRILKILQQQVTNPPLEQRWIRLDGTVIMVETSAGATTWKGKLAVQVLLRDISERKQAEEALRESRELLRLQFECMPVGCIVWGLDCIVRSWNPASENIFGYAAAEAIGRSANELIVPADIQMDLKTVWQGIVAGGQTVSSINKNRTKDGRQIFCEWTNTPLRDNNSAISGVISMVQDVTLRLEHEKEQLKIEKLESIGVLAGGIAHDFNNILTVIMGNITFAQMLVNAEHKAYKPLAEAEKASLRAGEMAQQLLSFAKGGEPVKKTVSVQQLVNEAVSLMLRGSNVKAAVKVPDSLKAIEADEGQISQVFNNIIINATHAMPDGGTLTVTAENALLAATNRFALPAGRYVKIEFADQGCGIAGKNLKKIFDPYFSTKETGSGLGLASAHSIVKRHGGHIGVTSQIGQGTTFVIYLPSLDKTSQDHDSGSEPQTAGDHQGGSILVMDDEQMIRDMVAEMLNHLGYQVTTCSNGEETLARYTAARNSGMPFLAVIMDLTIPGGMGGKETARQILELDPNACLIVSSGYSSDPIMADYSRYGFSGAVAKPYKVSELGHVLETLLL